MMSLQALSLGCKVDVWRPQTGVVHSAFERAVNLLMDGEMWTVVGVARQDAPFGIRLAPGGRSVGLDVRTADGVHVKAGYVGIGKVVLDCRTASCWSPARWAQPASGLDARLSAMEHKATQRAWPESADMASDVAHALCESDAELAVVVRQTVGRGPGLTPSGDDVLVGILAVLTSGAAGPAGVRATSRLVRALTPVVASTSDVSRHLLTQAARGLPGRALHDLGKGLMEGVPDDVLADVLDLVLDTGCTSGADACVGLAAASRFLFLNPERLAA